MLTLYLDGYSYEQVGERIGCDTKTVDNALQRVKRKIGVHLTRATCSAVRGRAPRRRSAREWQDRERDHQVVHRRGARHKGVEHLV